MKNILSSLNESEKKRILEMYYTGSAKKYLTEQKVYKDGGYSYVVLNGKYYYSQKPNPDPKKLEDWTEQTKPTGIQAIKDLIAKQGGTVAQTPQTPPGNPSKFSTPGTYYTTAPNGTSIGVNNTEYKKQDWQDLGGSGRVYLYGQDPKTGKWNISYGSVSCNTGQIDGNYKPLGSANDVVEYVSNNFCGEEIGKQGRMSGREVTVTTSKGTYPIRTVWKRKNNVTAEWKEAWFTDPLAIVSCSAKEATLLDKFQKTQGYKDLTPKDIKAIEAALLTVCS